MSKELERLRRKIARWYLALQQRHVDREWPALEIIMQEMARESDISSSVTKESTP